MDEPITIDIPHSNGRAQAREKIEQGIGQLATVVPGGNITEHKWEADTLSFTLEAMGQRVASRIEVFDDHVRASVDLPPFLALFGGKLRDKLMETGRTLLR